MMKSGDGAQQGCQRLYWQVPGSWITDETSWMSVFWCGGLAANMLSASNYTRVMLEKILDISINCYRNSRVVCSKSVICPLEYVFALNC